MSLAFPKLAIPPATGTFPVMAWNGNGFEPSALTYTPGADMLTIQNNGATAIPTPFANTLLDIAGVDGGNARVMMDTSVGTPTITGRCCLTSYASASAVTNNTGLLSIGCSGFGATVYATGTRASIQFQAAETWTDTSHKTRIIFQATPTASVTPATKLTLDAISATFASGVPVTASDTTDGTSGTAGAFNTLGGIGVTKAAWVGTNVTWANGVASGTVTDAATATATTLLTIAHRSSGTVANSFGTTLQFSGDDDGATQRVMSQITSTWTTAASGTRSSNLKFFVINSTVSTLAFTIASASATFASGVPVTISDSTASTTVSTGALIVSGGVGANGQGTFTALVASSGNVSVNTGKFTNLGSVTTQMGTGGVGFWRSGGTIGTAGDMVLQTDLGVTNGAYVFRGGPTTPITIATLSGSAVAGTTPGLATVGTSTITGGVTDGFNGSVQMTPTYDAATALTVTRHDYLILDQVLLTGAGPAACTDAAAMRFNAAIGTHKALAANGSVACLFTAASGPTGAQTAIQGWLKLNCNGTLRYIPMW